MKKLLSMLGVVNLTGITTISVVACNTGNQKDFIQLILPELGNSQWSDFQRTAEEYIASNDELNDKYEVRTSFSNQQASLELSNTQNAIDGGAKAVIIAQRDQNVTTASEYVTKNDVPLIGINIPFNSEPGTDPGKLPNYWVGQDYTTGSNILGRYVYTVLDKYKELPEDGTYNVFEIQGEKTMNGVPERHNGFKQAPKDMGNDDGWEYLGNAGKGEEIYGDWNNEKAAKLAGDNAEEILKDEDGVDVIYGHNDGMARAAQEALIKNPDDAKKFETTFDDDGNIEELGIIVVGYDYDSVTVGMIPKWKDDSVHNLFGAIEMSAVDMANLSMEKAFEEIENGNENKGKNIMVPLPSNMHLPEGILTEEEIDEIESNFL